MGGVGIEFRGGLGTVHPETCSLLNLVKVEKYILFSVCITKFRKFSSSKYHMNMTSERFTWRARARPLCLL